MFADASCATFEPRFADLTAPFVESPDGLLEVSQTQFDARTGLLSMRVSPTDLVDRTVADLVVSGLDPALPRTVIQDGVALPHHFSFRPTRPGWMSTSSGAIRLITTAAEHDIVVGAARPRRCVPGPAPIRHRQAVSIGPAALGNGQELIVQG